MASSGLAGDERAAALEGMLTLALVLGSLRSAGVSSVQEAGIPGSRGKPGVARSARQRFRACRSLAAVPERVSLLLDWLADNHQAPGLRVGGIAAAAGISPRRLQAICKRRFG